MSLIRRNVTRTIKNSTETTAQSSTPASSALAFNLQTTDAFYVGYNKPFACRHFNLAVVNSVSSTVSVKYWDGTTWTAVEDLVDQTTGFTASGFISWVNANDWTLYALTPVTDVELYWVKITVSVNLHASTSLQSVLNLFSDDNLLRAYYPELITDTRYLPSSRTDFMEQYLAAKDLVVTRLKQSRILDDESQIIDPNEVAVAATHAAAWIIQSPIARAEGDREAADKAYSQMEAELKLVRFDLDLDNTGIIEEVEKEVGNYFLARG